MKRVCLVLVALVMTAGMHVKAQNLVYDANAEVRKVEAFNGIDATGGISVYISQGTEQAVAVSAEDAKNVVKIKTEVKNGVLKIYPESGMWNSWNWGNKKIKAYITVTNLTSLQLGGGSIGKITDQINVTDLNAGLSGGSILNGKLKGTNLSLDLSGGSIGNLEGSFTSVTIEASGGSILKAYDTDVNSCKVEASGGAIISISVSKEISAEASGGSIITYKGDGVIKSIEASGGSIIKKKDS